MADLRVVTFGCRLNALESEAIRRAGTESGVAGTQTDVIVVNTCTVTAEAVRQARQAIRRARRDAPEARIIVTGCAAQAEPEAFAAMPEVDRVLGNAEKLDPRSFRDETAPVLVSDIMRAHEVAGPLIDGFDGRARAFVQIQQGCDHRCTFCVIPFVRGPNRSVPLSHIVEQTRRLVDRGFREVVLTGVDICSYSRDGSGGPTLGGLVKTLLAQVPSLPRLRLSTLDPAAIDDATFEVLADEPRLMPYWHLSLQAADDLTLKRMRRRHSRRDAATMVSRARAARPDIVFGADLIAGFPTETDAMFANTLAAVEEFGLTYLHVFPYSPRAGTPGARMPQVEKATRLIRARALREAGEAAKRRFFQSRVGAAVDAVVEKPRLARCAHYAPVRLDRDAEPGSVIQARIIGAAADGLEGTVVR